MGKNMTVQAAKFEMKGETFQAKQAAGKGMRKVRLQSIWFGELKREGILSLGRTMHSGSTLLSGLKQGQRNTGSGLLSLPAIYHMCWFLHSLAVFSMSLTSQPSRLHCSPAALPLPFTPHRSSCRSWRSGCSGEAATTSCLPRRSLSSSSTCSTQTTSWRTWFCQV